MKAIVEWGTAKGGCPTRPCGVSGQFTVPNPEQACILAGQLFHTLTQGHEPVSDKKDAWGVTSRIPRKVVWALNRQHWVCVSLLDGIPRGGYCGIADKEAEKLRPADVLLNTV